MKLRMLIFSLTCFFIGDGKYRNDTKYETNCATATALTSPTALSNGQNGAMAIAVAPFRPLGTLYATILTALLRYRIQQSDITNYEMNPFTECSDIWPVIAKGSHSFTCHPLTNHTCLYFAAVEDHHILAGTHCAYPLRDSQAELICVPKGLTPLPQRPKQP